MLFETAYTVLLKDDCQNNLTRMKILAMAYVMTNSKVVQYVTGVDRFYKDIELMIGYRPTVMWKYFWKFVTPAAIVVSISNFIPNRVCKMTKFKKTRPNELF